MVNSALPIKKKEIEMTVMAQGSICFLNKMGDNQWRNVQLTEENSDHIYRIVTIYIEKIISTAVDNNIGHFGNIMVYFWCDVPRAQYLLCPMVDICIYMKKILMKTIW